MSSSFSPTPTNLMGLPVMWRTDSARAAAGIAVQLRQDDAGDIQQVVEGLRDVDRVLSGHRVDDEQDLSRPHGVPHALELGHQRLVDVETAGGIDDDGVKPVFDCVLDGFLRRADGILRAALEHGQSGLLANDLQLFDGSGTIDVAGDQQHVLAVFLEHFAQLRAVRRLARSLQAAHQDDRRRLGSDLKLTVGAAHQRNGALR